MLEYEDVHDVTLVGWSYAGMVITGVADRVPEWLAHLVYLDAVVPDNGQSEYDADPHGPARHAAEREEAAAAGTPGFQPIPEAYIRARVPDDADLAWLLSRMMPHPLATFSQPVRLRHPLAAAIPRAYICCTEDKEPGFQTVVTAERVRADPRWRHLEITDNHMAPVTAPRETAELLLGLL
jgi:pimeloyl-ACP methyl ester carboxylesterase